LSPAFLALGNRWHFGFACFAGIVRDMTGRGAAADKVNVKGDRNRWETKQELS
jgi:hypothetical protein